MKLTNILYRRQYKIQLSSSTPNLDLKSLDTMGIWINPTDKHYLLTLKSGDDPNVDFAIFEKNFREKTGLTSDEAKIEAKDGPLTLQNAVDTPWF
ncbi:hypothetical protein FE407_08150 [Leuconostoc carnosum]|uniref:hypothetical protein n=1 Tax=Leuconostoc TaxID=1243 RepID=UPI000D513D28|nr:MULTISPECIES: hypothetical protein [Leuconostoc]KAA8324549.1 hypothetical protein FE404_07665 [Leuconostoc carnosum]KAA8358222.1 hypothetical protein FE407_08150 [Leuconostoc carnosum]KAA8364720.1 hypothetical protein FE406_08145 [Leuconostoc carnosum]KAA8365593.1 hypothetical protein FE416_08455 [Leuconostoc carnosum]KAA8371621.1 hypothetical protein FE415_08645 [Leuconostoc carnosum]